MILPTLFRSGSRFAPADLITGIIGILMQPWRLLADPSRLHLSLAGWLFRRAWLDRRRADRRLLAGAKEATGARRSLSHRGRLHLQRRLELARGRRDPDRLRARLDWPGRAQALSAIVRLCLVRWLWRGGAHVLGADEADAAASDCAAKRTGLISRPASTLSQGRILTITRSLICHEQLNAD